MHKIGLLLAVLILPSPGHGQMAGSLTPAEHKISWAQAEIKADRDRAQPYNDLAVAFVYRARETADASYYDQAEAALQPSFTKAPDNLEGKKAQVMIMLGRHEYPQALELARALNKRTPDDVLVYGLLADAAIELGDYREAEESAQWMLDLRPGNIPGLLRGARLRRLYGDTDGAMDFYSQAYQQIPPTQTEELAWTLTQMADLQFSAGHIDDAESLLRSALQKFSGYYLAIEASARLQTGLQHYSVAVELLQRRNEHFPSAATSYALAQALERAGQKEDAERAYKAFEDTARNRMNTADNANRELALYYVGHGEKPAEALRIAGLEITKRHDVRTQDAYALALMANGHYEEAKRQINSALVVGVRDAEIFYHAGIIAEKLQDYVSSARYLKQSLETNPSSDVSTQAHQALDGLATARLSASGSN
jgi:tetratricopeptide (TPR) repeat protein